MCTFLAFVRCPAWPSPDPAPKVMPPRLGLDGRPQPRLSLAAATEALYARGQRLGAQSAKFSGKGVHLPQRGVDVACWSLPPLTISRLTQLPPLLLPRRRQGVVIHAFLPPPAPAMPPPPSRRPPPLHSFATLLFTFFKAARERFWL